MSGPEWSLVVGLVLAAIIGLGVIALSAYCDCPECRRRRGEK